MYTLQATLFMYEYTNNRLPSFLSHIFPLNREIQESRLTRQSNLFFITRGVSNFSGSLPLYNLPRIWNEWTPENTRIYFTNTLQKSDPQKLYCILFRIRQMCPTITAGIVSLSDPTTLVNSLSFHHLTCCPLPFLPCAYRSNLLFYFLFKIIIFSLYMTLEYIKKLLKKDYVEPYDVLLYNYNVLLFLFGASRKTAMWRLYLPFQISTYKYF